MPSECPLCHAGSQTALLLWGEEQSYRLHRCPNCRLLHCTPLPDEEELETFRGEAPPDDDMTVITFAMTV